MVIPDLNNILLFSTAAFILIISPGPAVLYVTAKSMEQGKKAGFFSVLGVGAGAYLHVVAAAFGISALFAASTLAFSLLKYAGAIYLIYLGIKKLTEKTDLSEPELKGKPQYMTGMFYEGVVVSILNPKVATFFFAFLPIFVNEEKGGLTSQILFLGLIFSVMAFLSDMIYVYLASKMASWLKNSPTYLKTQKYVIGSVYILLGLLTFLVNKPDLKSKN